MDDGDLGVFHNRIAKLRIRHCVEFGIFLDNLFEMHDDVEPFLKGSLTLLALDSDNPRRTPQRGVFSRDSKVNSGWPISSDCRVSRNEWPKTADSIQPADLPVADLLVAE